MSGYAGGGQYDDGYAHGQAHGQAHGDAHGDSYYQDEHAQGYYDNQGYGDGYYDQGYNHPHIRKWSHGLTRLVMATTEQTVFTPTELLGIMQLTRMQATDTPTADTTRLGI